MPNASKNSDIALNLPMGVVLSIGEILFTVAIAALVKLISGDISVFMILFFRYFFCIPLLLLTALLQRGQAAFRVESRTNLAIRSAMGLGSFGCLFAALQTIDLSKMTALLQTIPVFVTLLAPFLLGETVGWRRRMAVAIGFIGVVLIIDPSTGNWLNKGVLLGLASPFFGALMLLSLRRWVDRSSPPRYGIILSVFFGVSVSLDIARPDTVDILVLLCSIGCQLSAIFFAQL